jgi:hypothetical protein
MEYNLLNKKQQKQTKNKQKISKIKKHQEHTNQKIDSWTINEPHLNKNQTRLKGKQRK